MKNTNSNKYLRVCKKCRNRIESYGKPAFELFCFVLVNHFKKKIIFFDDADMSAEKYVIPVAKFLEKKGIVLTREIHNSKSLIKLHVVEKYARKNGAKFLCWCDDN